MADFDNATPEADSHMIATYARIFDRNPGDFEAIQNLAIELMKKGPKNTKKDAFEHVAEHITYIYPAIMKDARLNDVKDRLVAEYGRMPSTPATRLRSSPNENSYGIAAACAVGVLVIVAAATAARLQASPLKCAVSRVRPNNRGVGFGRRLRLLQMASFNKKLARNRIA